MEGEVPLVICDTCAQPEHCESNGCFADKANSVKFGAVPGGTRMNSRTVVNPKRPEAPSWEKGVSGEQRPGGGFMPYLSNSGERIGVKEFGEKRRTYESIRRGQVNSS